MEFLDKILDPIEITCLERHITTHDELDLRRFQLREMTTNSEWKTDVLCVPQCIVEKLMFFIGCFTLDEEDSSVRVDTTANMEATVLAGLIWR
jgi:hypothetical protein